MRVSIPFLISLILCFLISSPAVYAANEGVNKVFTIGVISTKPKKRIKASTPLVDYIVEQMPEFDEGKVIVSESVDEMAELLESGEVSMLATTAYAALLIERQSRAKIAALRWKKGVESYHSVFFARVDSGINEAKDLRGRTITFEKDSSTSGFFVPSVYLLKKGFELQKMRSIKEKPDPDKIGYLFINDHLHQSNEVNMSIWVFHKRIDAAAFSNLDWTDPDTTPLNAKDKLHIIAETDPFPRSVMLTSATLAEQSKQDLLNILFEAEHTEQGAEVLRAFQKTSRFSPVSEELDMLLDQARKELLTHPELYK